MGESKGAFFGHERVPVLRDKSNAILKIPNEPKVDFSVTWSPGPVVDNTVEITYAFAINYTAYDADIVKHDIRIKPQKQSSAKP